MKPIAIVLAASLMMGASGVSIGAQLPQFASPALPDAEGSWTILITTTGGFTGEGRGSASFTSSGTRSCQLPSGTCSPLLSDEKSAPLKQFAGSFDASLWRNATPASISICSDCYVTTATFSRRESGLAKSYTFTWSIANSSGVPPDLVRIAELALSGKW